MLYCFRMMGSLLKLHELCATAWPEPCTCMLNAFSYAVVAKVKNVMALH